MTHSEFKNLLDKYSRGECTKHEEDLILQWYQNVDSGFTGIESEKHRITESRLWSKMRPQINPLKRHVLPIRKIAATLTILAVVSALTILGFNIYNNKSLPIALVHQEKYDGKAKVHVANTKNSALEISLSDGSTVVLQPHSEIYYPENFAKPNREVFLIGEAFFNVNRDTLHPFLVYSNEVITKVLGTSFTVKAYPADKEVTVAVHTGKVSVYRRKDDTEKMAQNNEVILIPNQEAVYSRVMEKVKKQLVIDPKIVLAKPTLFEMEYDGVSVTEIFKVLTENYGVDIVFDENDLSNCTLTTKMSDEGLYERIEIICKAIGAQYEIKDAVIVIKSDGCN